MSLARALLPLLDNITAVLSDWSPSWTEIIARRVLHMSFAKVRCHILIQQAVEPTCTPEVASAAKLRCKLGLPSLNLIYLLYENASK